MASVEIKVPDIGDFKDVPIIEIHVKPGDQINPEDPLLTLESDKATMDVPAPQAGTVSELRVKIGDRISQGSVILTLEAAGAAATPPKDKIRQDAEPAPEGPPPSYGSPAGVYDTVDVRVPDIGDFKNVPIIEIHVAEGDEVKAEDPLITLESDKATMDVPAPAAGKIVSLKIKVGDRISEGDLILCLQTGEAAAPPKAASAPPQAAPAPKPPSAARGDVHAEVLVLGAGPGGYSAAFRAADLGKSVVLVERWKTLGGVCLNVGCIPSKALLHAAKVVSETQEMSEHGLSFSSPNVDVDKLRGWKDGVVKKLTGGLNGLAKARKVTVVEGAGKFVSLNQVEVTGADGGTKVVSFEQAIIAAGSEPVTLPFIPHDDPRVIDSTGALELDGLPKRLLVLGGGIIGLEMATVYEALGSK
ncbi:MAG: FAD-dependent oxidoreductase, partial [Acetobacteraceae bacterium]|nr:FAD-dependent oxidoreductase [Acetobacteraceae bacterium]